MKPAALIFDFDGTLAELRLDFAALRAEVHRMARAAGWQGDWPPGLLLEEIAVLSAGLGAAFGEQALTFIAAREEQDAAQGRLFPYTRPLLAAARSQGLGLAVISRNSGAAIRRLYPQIEREVDAFLPREAAQELKPHPGHVQAALGRLGRQADEAALVGDHPSDMQAARAAGCLAVGVISGRSGAAELQAAGAQVLLPDAGGVLKALFGD